MEQEDQNEKGGDSTAGVGGGGGGGSSMINTVRSSYRKQKAKKVPQRGLGVAQLEKIRLEEQQQKNAAPALQSPPKSSSSYHPLPMIPNHKHNSAGTLASGDSYLASAPFSPDLSSKNLILRPLEWNQNLGVYGLGVTAQLTNPLGWLAPVSAHSQGSDNGAKLWSSCDHTTEKESCKADPIPGFCMNMNRPYQSNLVLPFPSLNMQYHQLPPSSSMVNLSSATCSLPSSLLDFQIEPPSNQIFCSNFTSMWPEQDKMVGFKRPSPFALDDPRGPFPSKILSIGRSDEPTASTESGNLISREGPSWSPSVLEQNPKKINKKTNGFLPGDFLTLAPPTTPTTTSMCSSSNFKHPAAVNLLYSYHEPIDFDSLPFHTGLEDSVLGSQANQCDQQQPQPYYSFFPAVEGQMDQSTSNSFSSCSGSEGGESVDLNLRL